MYLDYRIIFFFSLCQVIFIGTFYNTGIRYSVDRLDLFNTLRNRVIQSLLLSVAEKKKNETIWSF